MINAVAAIPSQGCSRPDIAASPLRLARIVLELTRLDVVGVVLKESETVSYHVKSSEFRSKRTLRAFRPGSTETLLGPPLETGELLVRSRRFARRQPVLKLSVRIFERNCCDALHRRR